MRNFRGVFSKALAGTSAFAFHNSQLSTRAQATSMSSTPSKKDLMPAVFINHGGGPMPVLGQQPEVKDFLGAYGAKFEGRSPRAVVVVTAHWEDRQVSVSSGQTHSLLYDYGGFPPESYSLKYPAPGEPGVAATAVKLLEDAGISVRSNPTRPWDHGTFIPLMCMFPDAQVPVVQISLVAGQDPKTHWDIGVALRPLREQGVLIVGSGLSFHNFKYLFAWNPITKHEGIEHAKNFANWLTDTVTDEKLSPEEREAKLVNWLSAPSAAQCHPRGGAEHFMPFFVVAGSALGAPGKEVGLEYAQMMNIAVSQYEFVE